MRPIPIAMFALAACGPSDSGTGCKDHFLPGDLVITEVFADFQAPTGGTGTDTGKEWFEVYNNTDRPVDLKGLTIVHSRPDGSKAQQHTMTEVTVAPGQYFTLGNATQDLVPAYVDYGYSADLGDFYNTNGGMIALKCTDAEIDSAMYDGVKAGHSRELTSTVAPDYTLNNDLANWCEGDATEFEPGNFGTPGSENDCQPVVVGACNDGGVMRNTIPPAIGDLVITEVMPKPKLGGAQGQWFEVVAMKDVDLNGVGLDRANDNNIKPEVITSPDCIHLAAGSYGLFTRDVVTVNNVPSSLAKFTFSLNPTATPDVQVVYGADVIDQVTWVTSISGASLSLDPGATDAASNDDPANFCNASGAMYNTMDFGSPAVANPACPLTVPPGQCIDGGSPRPIVKPTGQLKISEVLPNPAGTGTDATQEWFEITNTAAAGTNAFDLNELGLKGGAATINVIHSQTCKSITGGGFALFAHSTDSAVTGLLDQGVAIPVDATFTFALASTVSVLDGATPVDAVTLVNPQPADGVARSIVPTLCDSPKDAAHQYNAAFLNYGTPRKANSCM